MSCVALVSGLMAYNANAIDFNKDFYGKANVNIGYAFSGYAGDVKDEFDIVEDMNVEAKREVYKTKKLIMLL